MSNDSNLIPVKTKVELVGNHPHAGKTGKIVKGGYAVDRIYLYAIKLDNHVGECLARESKLKILK